MTDAVEDAPVGAKAKQASSVLSSLPDQIPEGAEKKIPDILDALSKCTFS